MVRRARLQLEEYDPDGVLERIRKDEAATDEAFEEAFDLSHDGVTLTELRLQERLEESRRGTMPDAGTVH